MALLKILSNHNLEAIIMQSFETTTEKQSPFTLPAPEKILDLVEDQLGIVCTNMIRPLNSYINRVFELQDREGNGLIIKFYRPGRWSQQALQEEHLFLLKLQEIEMPVVAPLQLKDGSSLGQFQGVAYALFPKFGGRSSDEFTDDQWLELGRMLARVHAAGDQLPVKNRPFMHPAHTAREQQKFLLESGLIQSELMNDFISVSDRLIEKIEPLFDGLEMGLIHGDCHFSNILIRPDEPMTLIDFDDMVVGPPVQDLWMLLPDVPEQCYVEIDLFLEGYNTFKSFDTRTINLIEPLRGMRYIHYMAWCAYQAVEDGDVRVIDQFGSRAYWQQEIADIDDVITRIDDALENPFSMSLGNS